MKLSEIIQEAIDLDNAIPVNLKHGKNLPDIKGEHLGQGVEATAYHTGQGTITKIIEINPNESPKDNSTIRFLKLILQHQDNPFFPRIYNAKLYRNRNYKSTQQKIEYFMMVQIEKLTPISQKNIYDILPSIFKQIGVNPTKEKYDDNDIYTQALLDMDVSELKELSTRSKNPKFKEAINLLAPYITRYGNDLHDENLMIRLTPHGPQLVITDPIPPNM
jgi:hypothetical protein